MTLVAILADVHGNREALDACLTQAYKQGAQRFVFLGDLVGYGADPGYVIDLAADYGTDGAIVIKGNHDAAIAEPSGSMNAYASAAIDWTRERLTPTQKDFLAALPLTAELPDTLLVHAEAANPRAWTYITHPIEAERSLRATSKRVTICGHVHCPQLYCKFSKELPAALIPTSAEPLSLGTEQKWLAVLGSVGQPRDDIPSAAYALYDDARTILTFHRAAYDIDRAAHKIRTVGLPPALADRLYLGR